jgi:ABC-type ATPase with predicted acetyltransferase domain
MPSFDIIKKVQPDKTFRVSNVISNFDLDIEHIDEHFTGNIDIEGGEWNVGLIVGGSGTGKSTIAKECFGEAYSSSQYTYSAKSVIDDMPKGKSIKEIEKAFTSVGFASPPSWLKPYGVLSNGEKMRVDLARNILDDKELIIFDEFTSVVNREVAKTSSYAISKAVRKQGKKFIAVACHRDIIEWLEPDWIYDTDEKRFFIAGESLTAPNSSSKYIGLTTKLKSKFGSSLGSITI